VKDPWGKTRIGAEGSLVINRQDYNIAHDPSGKMVGNSVKINLNLEAIKDKKGE
jgi:polyisoprenoid-binding protein YceI